MHLPLVVISVVCLAACETPGTKTAKGETAKVDVEKKPAAAVRQLDIDFPAEAPRGIPFRLVAERIVKANSIQVLKDLDQCKKLLGKEWGVKFAKRVDFKKEKLVLVIWELTGDSPKNWKVAHNRNGKTVDFAFKRVRKGSPINLITIGMDVFAVQKELKVVEKLVR